MSDARSLATQGARPRHSSVVWTAIGTVVFVGIWAAYAHHLNRPLQLATPAQVVDRFADGPAFFLRNTWVTAREMLIGLAISLTASTLIGALLAASRRLESAFQPVLVVIMVTPWVAYMASVTLFAGYGGRASIMLIAVVTIPAFVYGVDSGLRSADPAAAELFASVNASRRETFWHLRFPSALPAVFTATRINFGLALGAAYFAETSNLSSAKNRGLGYVGSAAATGSDGIGLWTTIFCAVALGLMFQLIVVLLEQRMLRWHASQRDR